MIKSEETVAEFLRQQSLPVTDISHLINASSSFFGGFAQSGITLLFVHVELGNPPLNDRFVVCTGIVIGSTVNTRCQIRSDIHSSPTQITQARNVILGDPDPSANVFRFSIRSSRRYSGSRSASFSK